MNKLFLSTCLAAAAAMPAFAGVENLNYQAVLRQNDRVLDNQKVELKFFFEQNGQVIYTEEATATTDAQGLVKWLIGTNESLEGINWNSSDINLKVAVNTGDGFAVVTDGAIASVPTALYALRTAATDELEAKIDDNYDDLKGSIERNEGSIRSLQSGVSELNEAVEELMLKNNDEKFLEITADIERLTGTQEDLVAFSEMVNDELTRLKNQAEEDADFFQRVSDELTRLGEEAEKIDENYDELKGYNERNEQAISVLQGKLGEYDEFNQRVSDELAKMMGLDYDEIADFNQRVSDELARLGEEAQKIDENYDELKGYTTRNEGAISVLQGKVGDLEEAVEGIVNAGYDEKFMEIGADLARIDGFIETADDFNERVSAELTRLGEEAEKIDDNYDELKGYTTRNEGAISELQSKTTVMEEALADVINAGYDEKFMEIGADLARIDGFIETADDFNQRVSDELTRLAEEAEKIDDNYDELKGYTTRNEGAISELQSKTTVMEEALADVINAGYDEKFMEISADLTRIDGFIETADDFNQRVSDELTRLGEAQEEQANFNQSVSDELAKLVGLDATEIDDFNQRVSDELTRLAEEAEKIDDNYDELKGYNDRNEQAISVLQGKVSEVEEAVEGIINAGYDEKFMEISADLTRIDGFIETADDFNERVSAELTRLGEAQEEQANFNQSVSDELAKLVGLDATEIDDFNQRVSDELSRLAEEAEKIDDNYDELKGYITRNESAISVLQGKLGEYDDFNQRVSDELAKFQGLDADEIADFNQRVSDELSRLAGEAEKIDDNYDELKGYITRNESAISVLQGKLGEYDDFNQRVSDELAKLQGIDADEIADFNQRVSDELTRLNDAQEEQATFNQSVSDALAKLVGLDADEISDFNERVSGELTRLNDAQEEQVTFNQSVSDALAKLVGLDADEISDFNERVSGELTRLGDAQEEQATFNQNVSDELSKIQGLTYTEVTDWMERANQTIIDLQNTIEQLQQEVEALKANN